MTGTKGHSGGKRAGAGRKPRSTSARIHLSLRLDPATHATILAHRCAGDSIAAVVDRIVAEWAAQQAPS